MTPNEAWAFVKLWADFTDEGPRGEGWRSDEMLEAMRVLDAAFEPETRPSAGL